MPAEKKFVIRVHGIPTGPLACLVVPEGTSPLYFHPDCNVEALNGLGKFVFTHNIDEAISFSKSIDAFDWINSIPSNHPVRLTDGKPNKPLTAFTTELVPVEVKDNDA